MYASTVVFLVIAVICFALAAPIGRIKKGQTIAFVLIGIACVVIAVLATNTENSRAKSKREATEQIETHEGIEITSINLRGTPRTVRYTKEGQYCEATVLKHDDQWLLADDAKCAVLP